MKKSKYIKIAILAVISFVFICAFDNKITVSSYTLKTDMLDSGSSVVIVLISDLHSTIHGADQQPLIEKVRRQNPDLILLSGDIADDDVPIKGTQMLLSGICDIAPVYYVTGNHEYWSSDVQSIKDEIQSFGVTSLSDSYEQIEINGNKIIVAGIEDPDKGRYEAPGYDQFQAMEKAFRELDRIDIYKVLIAHRPENIESYCQYSFDLVVSGHAHGGQVRIPFLLNGLCAPNQGLFPKYAGGLYEHGSLVHIVSRGLSIDPRMPRIFNPPELVTISIESDI